MEQAEVLQSGTRMKSSGSWDSAAEERQQKLLEYLAAKGKLKPPNPKPYLRDATNRLQAARTKPSKVGPVVLQKENIHSNPAETKARPVVLPGRPPDPPLRTSNVVASQRLRNVPQKVHSKAAARPSRPSLGKAPYRGSSQRQERVVSSTTCRQPRDDVVCQKQEAEKPAEMLKDPLCSVSSVSEVWEPSRDEQQALKVVQEQPLEGCSDLAFYKQPPLKDKAKAELNKKVAVSRKNAITTRPPAKSVRNVPSRTTSRNGSACTYVKSSDTTGKTSKAVVPVRSCGKTVPTIPLSKKVLHDASSNTLLSGRGKAERKSAVVKASSGVAKAGISMSAIQTERAGMVKLQERHTELPHVVKNTRLAAQKSKSITGIAGCLQNKSKDAVMNRRTEDHSATTFSGRPPNRRPMFYTPAPVSAPAPVFPRKAVTEVKGGQDGRRGISAEESRRRRLDDWMNSKGKAYKRPAMILPAKKPVQKKARLSFWAGIEEEDELNSLAEQITKALSECLRLVEEGCPSESVQTILSKIPQCEKFAKYWVCKAKLLQRDGTFDVIGLYEQAVRAGAAPIEDLRETIFNIMKNINKKSKAVTFGPLPDEEASVSVETVCNIQQSSNEANVLPYHDAARDEDQGSHNILTRHWTDEQGSALKFKIAQLPRLMQSVVPDWKMLTPVRRSLRIERTVSCYPETLREHDTVVSSLNDLLDTEESNCFVYRENEALPKEIDSKIRAL